MNEAHIILRPLQLRMDRIWSKHETALSRGDLVTAGVLLAIFHALEDCEEDLFEAIKQIGKGK